jgi:hypothetical protein
MLSVLDGPLLAGKSRDELRARPCTLSSSVSINALSKAQLQTTVCPRCDRCAGIRELKGLLHVCQGGEEVRAAQASDHPCAQLRMCTPFDSLWIFGGFH